MSTHISQLPRSSKADIARQIYQNLNERKEAGPPEPGLDAFIQELDDVAGRLDTHIQGKLSRSLAHSTHLAHSEMADVDVDTMYRHIEDFLSVEADRRSGPHIEEAAAMYKVACPKGLAYVDARIPEENAYCRSLLAVLRSPEHQDTLTAIRFPMAWLDELDAALTKSEKAFAEATKAQGEKGGHVDLGRNAEQAWEGVMFRLRRYIESRADRKDVAKRNEGRMLLKPLLDAIQKQKADAAARATRRAGRGTAMADPA
jgi:hypothetical protein